MAFDPVIADGTVADGSGMAADIPVFDEAAVKPRLPTVEHGLPSGFRRRRMPHAAATRYFRRRHARLGGASMSRFQSRTGGN